MPFALCPLSFLGLGLGLQVGRWAQVDANKGAQWVGAKGARGLKGAQWAQGGAGGACSGRKGLNGRSGLKGAQEEWPVGGRRGEA